MLIRYLTSVLEESLTDLIDLSVSRQLVPDVPTGLFLSGGIDSSALAASIAAQSNHDITALLPISHSKPPMMTIRDLR